MQKIGKPVKYFAVKPTAVIEKLKKNTLDEMNGKIETLSTIKDTTEYKELELLHSSNTDLIKKQDISGTIKGRTNINSQITDVINSSAKELILCAPVSEVKRRIKLLEPLFKQVKETNLKLTLALNGEDEDIKSISDRLGIKAKKSDIQSSFYIADRSQVLFMLNDTDDNNEQMAVWFSSPFFVKSFTSLFDIAMKKK
jgi:sugar-specific transcriptional regulator TrmB